MFGALHNYANNYGISRAITLLQQFRRWVSAANMRDHAPIEEVENLARETHTIELKFDTDNPEIQKIIRTLMRKAARQVLTSAALLADGREPQVAYSNRDFFEGGTKQDLSDDVETVPDTGGETEESETNDERTIEDGSNV